MSIRGVLRTGDVGIRVKDLDRAVRHYVDVIGLKEVLRDGDRAYLRAWDEHDHHSVVLRQADGAGMDFMGFKVLDTATLDALEKDLAAFGCSVERLPAGAHVGCGERVRFQAPTGHTFDLYAEKEKVGNGMPTTNPEVRLPETHGMHPSRFDHCLLYGDDVDGSVALFTEVLGFDLAEQIVDGEVLLGAFLTANNKPHDVAFIRHEEKDRFHHAAFYLESWDEILRAADLISIHDVPLDIGPTRHGITRGATIYFFDPSGNRNEVFSGGYIRYPDMPTLTWTADKLGKGIFYHDRELNENFLSVMT